MISGDNYILQNISHKNDVRGIVVYLSGAGGFYPASSSDFAGGGGGGSSSQVQLTGSNYIKQQVGITAVITSINASTGNIGLVSGAYESYMIYNNSTSNLYVGLGTGIVSNSNFSFIIEVSGFYESPKAQYSGTINGIWDTATGSAKVTTII